MKTSKTAALLDALSGLLWPPRCAACGRTLPYEEGPDCLLGVFCDRCRESVALWSLPACPRCGEPYESGPSHLCGACLESPPAFDGLDAALLYGGAGAEAVVRFKHSLAPWAAAPLGRLLAHVARADPRDAGGLLFAVPVPLHPRRLRERGFNQSALLAREIASAAGIPMRAGLLKRVRETRPRKGLTRKERRADLTGAFVATNPARLEGAHVLLVDDVVTTGATVRSAARALRDGGAESIRVVCLARAAID